MLYDQYFIDDLKNRADIVRIIQPYAQDLKKKGANWMACCPFHPEKTPSFSVNPSKGFYKCFGCGKGGTAFNFVMEMEGLNFPEAIKRVAELSGVMLPEPVDDKAYEQGKKKRGEKSHRAPKREPCARRSAHFTKGDAVFSHDDHPNCGDGGKDDAAVSQHMRSGPDEVDADGRFPSKIPQETDRHAESPCK